MKNRFHEALRCLVPVLAILVSATAMNCRAQAPAPVGEKVSGQQLQAWLDAKFGYAGVHKPSQCVIMNVAQGTGRTLFIRCPDGWAEKLSGSARVVGDTYCTSFPIPNTPPGEDCVTWYRVGEWKFEQRKGNELDTTVMILPQGLASPK